ncbi:MAG: hypothetical protein AAGK37_23580 [Pseudomonadota bacterium]
MPVTEVGCESGLDVVQDRRFDMNQVTVKEAASTKSVHLMTPGCGEQLSGSGSGSGPEAECEFQAAREVVQKVPSNAIPADLNTAEIDSVFIQLEFGKSANSGILVRGPMSMVAAHVPDDRNSLVLPQ